MRSSRAVVVLAVTLALLYTARPPSEARANGRFPKAQAIATVPGADGRVVYLRATFGILVSRDAGRSWRWLCEQALGFSSTWDPPIAATKDGRLWVALTDGARTTTDGCAIDDVPSLAGELVADLAVDGGGERVFAVTSTPGKPAFVWRTEGARGFVRLGKGISGFRFDTVEVAPSNPSRLYLTATPDGAGKRAHLFRSDDGGKTIVELAPALPNEGRLFVSAVDPRDPDRVFVRQLADTGSDVLLSKDGGATFASALHMKGAMFGFTRTDDGGAYYAGGGDPNEGIWRSLDRGATWQAGAKTSVFCLNAQGSKTDRLFVCSNPYVPGGYAVAASIDRGATVNALAKFDDVLGPVTCEGGVGGACVAPWPETRAAIATSARPQQPVTPPDAGAVDAGKVTTRPPAGRSTCGCRVVGARSGSGSLQGAMAMLALLAAAAVRRSHPGSRGSQRRFRPDHRPTAIDRCAAKGGSRPTTREPRET